MKALKSALAIATMALLCGCAQKVEHKSIAPLPAGIDISDIHDCTVSATFNTDDFRWMGGNLRMTIYTKDLYDAVEISQMQVGDTLIYESKPMVINKIEDADGGGININGGLEEGGCWLVGYEGGTYIARTWDDHAIYSELGKAEVALSEDFIIVDCGIEPNDPNDTIRTEQKLYLENLQDYRREFNQLNTHVTIENGLVTEINRHWIP